MYIYYCNDSLDIYSQFFGDFNQKELLTKDLYRSDKYVLRKIHFIKQDDKILFHSFTTLNPVYNVLGLGEKILTESIM